MPERPIRDMLSRYIACEPARFHMPGHKGRLSPYDVTELSGTDDLNHPGKAVRRAQELLSDCYRSNKSYFLCGGSTEGLKAMFRYLKITGRGIIMPRNSHKNAFYACIENDIEPVIIDTGRDLGPGARAYHDLLIQGLHAHPEAGAVFLTRPDYCGRCMDLTSIAAHARNLDMLVLCDAAHGAHFALSGRFPYDAAGHADLWVHSAHKTLGARTPSAFLHCSEKIDAGLIGCILPSVRTSSPDFELIMSMDDCRAQNFDNSSAWGSLLDQIEQVSMSLDGIPGVKVLDRSWAQHAGWQGKDPTRLVLDVAACGGGFYVKKMLEQRNIFVEMADFQAITAILTPYDKPEWYAMLVDGMENIVPVAPPKPVDAQPEPLARAMQMREAYYTGRRFVELTQAQGCISSEVVGAYPPGTPAVLPGERFNQSVIEYLTDIERAGGSLFGVSEGVRVI